MGMTPDFHTYQQWAADTPRMAPWRRDEQEEVRDRGLIRLSLQAALGSTTTDDRENPLPSGCIRTNQRRSSFKPHEERGIHLILTLLALNGCVHSYSATAASNRMHYARCGKPASGRRDLLPQTPQPDGDAQEHPHATRTVEAAGGARHPKSHTQNYSSAGFLVSVSTTRL